MDEEEIKNWVTEVEGEIDSIFSKELKRRMQARITVLVEHSPFVDESFTLYIVRILMKKRMSSFVDYLFEVN